MKTKLRRLIFSALLLSGTSMTFAENGASTAVGDLPSYGKNASSKASNTTPKPQASVRVGDLDVNPQGPSSSVSDFGSNFVSDSHTNKVTDFGTNVVGDVVPDFVTQSNSGTVVIGLAPSMVTDLPESARSSFIKAVPLPIVMKDAATPPPLPAIPAPLPAIPAPLSAIPKSTSGGIAKLASPPQNGLKDTNSKASVSKADNNKKPSDRLQTVDVQPFKPIAFQTQKESVNTHCDCVETCDGGCDPSSKPNRTSRLRGLFDRCPDQSWLSTEFLLWRTQDRDSPALITKSPIGTDPILPDADVVFGDKLKGEFSGGFRLDAGKFVTENVGVGGRFWILANNNDSFYADARPSDYWMGRPFFNAKVGTEDALLISGPGGSIVGIGDVEGEVSANSSVNVWAAEAYARLRLNCNNNCKVEFISGYSHFSLDDELSINSITYNTSTLASYQFNDLFDTKNQFDGGQLGLEMSLTEGRWTFRSLTKVHLGNMNQQVTIAGDHSVFNGATTTSGSGGLLALGNQGNYERNEFSFIPEANLKLEYCVRKNVALNIGYSFLYFDNVALAGAQVDRIIDPIGPPPIGTSGPPWPAHPTFSFNDSSMWLQGLDLGLRIDF
ncbi:MAG: BBP7 family outer membrane beta-barrel protein [Rubripirellula sp.]|nr:BBP7 family outer membrane beta-barrel protein [Rubripirellula sp.]